MYPINRCFFFKKIKIKLLLFKEKFENYRLSEKFGVISARQTTDGRSAIKFPIKAAWKVFDRFPDGKIVKLFTGFPSEKDNETRKPRVKLKQLS